MWGNINLRGADLRQANLTNVDLSGADLSGASLKDAKLDDAILCHTKMPDGKRVYSNCKRANLSKTDLRRAGLTGANLSYANLTDANLSETDLSYANLTDANLTGADLSKTNLSGANLYYADLTEANLTDANLSETDLSKADLIGTKLKAEFIKDGVEKTFVEIISGCEGEMCYCKSNKTFRPFSLYDARSEKSALLGVFKPGVKAKYIESKIIIYQKGEYLVKHVGEGKPVKMGDKIHSRFYAGEGFLSVRYNGMRFEGDFNLKEIKPTELEIWDTVEVIEPNKRVRLTGYTKSSPFKSCFDP
jgi:uncharacterized protein YjbI with pentapeptide repeats